MLPARREFALRQEELGPTETTRRAVEQGPQSSLISTVLSAFSSNTRAPRAYAASGTLHGVLEKVRLAEFRGKQLSPLRVAIRAAKRDVSRKGRRGHAPVCLPLFDHIIIYGYLSALSRPGQVVDTFSKTSIREAPGLPGTCVPAQNLMLL